MSVAPVAETAPTCRSCGGGELEVFLSLGDMPLPDALLRPDQLALPEPRMPLDVAFCPACSLVQILEEVPPERLFVENYLYFSSFSEGLLRHSREHAERLITEHGLDGRSLVVEVASNDGYLLRNFVARGVPVLGIDPAPHQAAAAEAAGVPTLNSFVEGIAILLADDGVATIENTYVRDLIDHCEFDTIYHEHFCYFSCTAVDRVMRRHGLVLNRVEYFPGLQGGTLRWHVSRRPEVELSARRFLEDEETSGLVRPEYYRAFGDRVATIGRELPALLRRLRTGGRRIAAYGAAAKGSTLVNYAGIGTELVDYVVDRNVHKHGLHMPGTQLPIRPVEALLEDQPDYVLLLAWNYRYEIAQQQAEYLARGGRFIVPVPEPRVV
jgi:hypothetical protein